MIELILLLALMMGAYSVILLCSSITLTFLTHYYTGTPDSQFALQFGSVIATTTTCFVVFVGLATSLLLGLLVLVLAAACVLAAAPGFVILVYVAKFR